MDSARIIILMSFLSMECVSLERKKIVDLPRTVRKRAASAPRSAGRPRISWLSNLQHNILARDHIIWKTQMQLKPFLYQTYIYILCTNDFFTKLTWIAKLAYFVWFVNSVETPGSPISVENPGSPISVWSLGSAISVGSAGSPLSLWSLGSASLAPGFQKYLEFEVQNLAFVLRCLIRPNWGLETAPTPLRCWSPSSVGSPDSVAPLGFGVQSLWCVLQCWIRPSWGNWDLASHPYYPEALTNLNLLKLWTVEALTCWNLGTPLRCRTLFTASRIYYI